MTFTKIRLKWGPRTSDTITFRFDALNMFEPYLVKSITGLEGPDQVVSLSEIAEEGAGLQGVRTDDRQIVIQLGFQPDYSLGQSVEGLRRALYPMRNPKLRYKLTVQLLNEDETEIWQTTGRVSKMPTNPFTKDPEVQITINCLSPYWSSIGQYVHPNPSDISGQTTFTINNSGDATTGFETVVTLTAANSFFRFFTEDESEWIHITYPFAIGDVLTINTSMGSRKVSLNRGGNIINMLQYFSPNTSWLQLDSGDNVLKPNTTSYVINSWTHTPRFWGI